VQDTKYFDSADWALGQDGGSTEQAAPLQPKLEVRAHPLPLYVHSPRVACREVGRGG
jgi:hypothetical protein